MISLICYHKNARFLYPSRWIEVFRDSILNQTFKEYEILELEYSGGDFRIFENSKYESKPFATFIHAMNYLLDKSVSEGYDCTANSNVDDIYKDKWLETEVPFIKDFGYDIVSSNFSLLKNEVVFLEHRFHELNIKEELNKNHNPLCHPTILYSNHFIQNNKYVPEEFPTEDLQLWKRTIDNFKFKIVSENLLYHRIHDNSVCKSSNR